MLEHRKHLIKIDTKHTLCLHQIGDKGEPILMIHGAMENSSIFFSKNMKGIAPFFARNGYNIFILDLSGKGESTPLAASKKNNRSQTVQIKEDIPRVIDFILEKTNSDFIHLCGHSWGSILIMSFYARSHSKYNIKSIFTFGAKRRISIFNLEKFLKIDILYRIFGTLSTLFFKYIPAVKFNVGADDEQSAVFKQMMFLNFSKEWVDDEDGFRYSLALQKLKLPPLLFLTGKNDLLLGNPVDVALWLCEFGSSKDNLRVIGKSTGHLHDYDHVDILTHKDAEKDHFSYVLEWLRNT